MNDKDTKKWDIKELFPRLISDKKKLFLIALLAVGVLMIAVGLARGEEEANAEGDSLSDYKARLEEELEELCSSVEGAGKCRVTVSFSEGERREYRGSTLIGLEPPRVEGITVVCEGADDIYVKRSISDCMTALFGIGANRVAILKMH